MEAEVGIWVGLVEERRIFDFSDQGNSEAPVDQDPSQVPG